MGKQRIKLLSKQRVPIAPEVVRKLGGDPAAALYYRQLQFYDSYEADTSGWFDKNSVEIENDTGLNRRRQEHSRSKLEHLGWIETRTVRGGSKPTCYFRILTDFY